MSTALASKGLTDAVKSLARGVAADGTVVKLDYNENPKAVAWFHTHANDIFVSVPEYLRLREEADRSLTEGDFLAIAAELRQFVEQGGRTLNKQSGTADGRTKSELAGLLVHESSHAVHSTWGDLVKGIKPHIVNTMVLFEESRIEKRAVDNAATGSELGGGYIYGTKSKNYGRYPSFRVKQYLRAVTRLFLETMTEFKHPLQVIHAWALTRGRMVSGTMKREEFAPIDNAARTLFGDDLIDDLSDIQDEAIGLSINEAGGFDRLVELAEEWNETLGVKEMKVKAPTCGHGGHGEEEVEGEAEGEVEVEGADSDGEGAGDEGEDEEKGSEESTETTPSGSGADGTKDGDSEGSEGKDKVGGDKTDEKPEDGEKLPDSAWDDIPDDLPEQKGGMSPEGMGSTAEFTQAIKQVVDETDWDKTEVDLSNPREISSRVFGRKPKYDQGAWFERKPSPEETRAAIKLANHLEALTIPSIARTKVQTEKPTGRIKSREAVRQSADRAQGRMSTAKPWIDKRMKHGTGAPVIVGIATDISGSMSWAEKMVASTAYIVGRAGHHINAKTAAVTFGNGVEMVVNPDELPTTVRVRDANGGTEEFDKAMAALDGILRLSSAPGAKVLVVVSDNELVIPHEPERRAAWIDKFTKAGVQVIWVDGHDRSVPNTTSVAISRSHANDPMHLVKVISEGIDKAFAKSKGW